MDLEASLPPELRGAGAVIAKIGIGQSGAGVYRVDVAGRALVLKIDPQQPGLAPWDERLAILRAASDAGVAPRVVHVDPERHAVLSERIEDRGFIPRLMTPATRADALAQLGETLRRVHAIPTRATPREPTDLLRRIRDGLAALPQPAFVADVQARMLAEPVPDGGAPVLSHNDVNPTNVLYDGARVVLLDWDAAGANDRDYDAATAATFLRMDDASCAALVGGEPSPRFRYDRRLVAVTCGTIFLHLARVAGHAGATDDDGETLAAAHARMRAGALDLSGAAGKWAMGLSLLREARALG